MGNRMQRCGLVDGLPSAPGRAASATRQDHASLLTLATARFNDSRFPIPYSSLLATNVVSARSPVTFNAVRHMSRK
ncbi:hypothetical protein FHY21_001744 [Xanthomonas arboricola]